MEFHIRDSSRNFIFSKDRYLESNAYPQSGLLLFGPEAKEGVDKTISNGKQIC